MAFAAGYLQKYAPGEALISEPPAANLQFIIAIPAYKEPELLPCLKALYSMDSLPGNAEILLLLNAPEGAPQETVLLHDKTEQEAMAYANAQTRSDLKLRVLNVCDLPQKHFGAGLARKIVMDEAARRFNRLNRPEGIIISLDADTLVQPNYIGAIHELFNSSRDIEGCSIHFEHPLEMDPAGLAGSAGNPADAASAQPPNPNPRGTDRSDRVPPETTEAIINYELHLRYYLDATRYTGYPFAIHTVGSAFAVQADAYCRYGGMNRRQAGEDFYFIQKVAQNGHFRECNTTTVFPSPRASDRVLFGTGADITKQLQQPARPYRTYHPEIFSMLKQFYEEAHRWYIRQSEEDSRAEYRTSRFADSFDIHEVLLAFLEETGFEQAMAEILSNTASEKSFLKRFYKKFNWLWLLRFIHFAEERGFDPVPLEDALQQAYAWNGRTLPSPEKREILHDMRRLQKEGHTKSQ